ncbi:MAG: DivIVA domain-containing protein [Bacillota bacterium]|nr:DivIVA domain-containing protein [Bacillota bacterium]
MIRPIDIQEKEFSRAVRGYKEDEVNAFLDEITIDLERLFNELRETKEENSRLVEELERHRGSEGTVVETLEAAKSLMADISASAEKRADILLKNAELDAELMKKEAREAVESLARESEALRTRFFSFRSKYKQLLEAELSRFDSLTAELFPEYRVADFDDLPERGPAPQPVYGVSTDTLRTSRT